MIDSQYKSLLAPFFVSCYKCIKLFKLMKIVFAFASAVAISIIPTPSFCGELEQKEMMSVTEQLLP